MDSSLCETQNSPPPARKYVEASSSPPLASKPKTAERWKVKISKDSKGKQTTVEGYRKTGKARRKAEADEGTRNSEMPAGRHGEQ